MKIKSILSLLLVVILCLSCAVACSRKKEEEKTKTDPKESANDKAVIVKAINGFTLGGVIEDLEGTSVSYEEYMDAIKDLSGGVGADLSVFDEDYSFSAFMNDGIMAMNYNDDAVYSIYKDDGSMVGITSDYRGDGYIVTLISADDINQSPAGSVMNPGDMDAILEEYLGMLGLDDSAIESVKGFKLPKITEDDLSLKDGYYVISSSCYGKVADSVLEFMADIAGEEIPEEVSTEVDEAVEIIKKTGFEIGFAVTGENITGFKVAVDCDFADLAEYIGEDASGKIAASFEMKLTSDAQLLDSVKVSVDANIDESITDSFSAIKGSASIGFIYDSEKQPAGISVAVDAEIKDAEISAEWEEDVVYTDEDGYTSHGVTIYSVGDMKASAKATIDFTKLDSKGGKVVDAEASYSYDAKSLTCEYDGLDLNKYNVNDYDQSASVKASATTQSKNKAEFSASVKFNGTEILNLASGTLDLSAAPVMNLPAIVVSAQSDSFEATYERLEAIGEEMERLAYNNYENYCYYDAASGLYVYANEYGHTEIGTINPVDYFDNESYNNYNA